MPQIQLPMFPAGVTHITDELAFECRDGTVTYFNGVMPVLRHASNDVATFRMITSQFVVNGNARNADIIRAFGVPAVTVKRAVKRYRESGAKGFYAPRRQRGAAVLTAPVIAAVQGLLDAGLSVREVATRQGMKADTLRKAVQAGRLHEVKKSAHPARPRAEQQESAQRGG